MTCQSAPLVLTFSFVCGLDFPDDLIFPSIGR
jgi:hypothetical protein